MKDHDDEPSPNPSATQHHQHRLSTARSSNSYGSYEVGESSTAASFSEPSTDMTISTHSPRMDADEPSSGLRAPDSGARDLSREVHKRRRSHKPRSSGGFLLSNPMLDEQPKAVSGSRDDGRRRSRIPVDSRKGKGSSNVPDKSNITGFPQAGLGINIEETRRLSDGQTGRVMSPAPEEERRHSHGGRRTSRIPSLRSSTAPLDVDSTQIVNMALNLSESRRLAERRNISSPIPPRLAQLPDSLAGGSSLKQHLQQQRRTSRTISPKPEKLQSPRVMSASVMTGPFQPQFNSEDYTYHFSSSTLNRAQKAKDYLELMGQYRRLLQILPPLKPDARSRPSSSSHSTSPTSAKPPLNPLTGSPQVVLGRAYNPLQFIRNRKVRARKREAIDGESQGFSDVSKVTSWIDEATTSAATSTFSPGAPSLPPFIGAHEKADQDLPASNIPRPISTVGKPKRIRIDWNIDPADMIADTYWLEQGDNKYLIEDRHYSKIFSRKPETRAPVSSQTSEPVTSTISISSTKETDASDVVASPGTDHASPTKIETDVPPLSARDRARQKLQDFRGNHHKQNGISRSHHDILHFRKGSLSDTSDSETDRRRWTRSGTISANGRDLLDKQIMDMLAKETTEGQKDKENADEYDRRQLKQLPSRMATPDKTSHTPEQLASRRGSRVEILDNIDKAGRGRVLQGSPLGSGRPSLEVPGPNYRLSTDLDSSRPVSPDLRPSRGNNVNIPTIGMDLSPPESRPGSPGRKPFSRVKNIFRDRSRERERGPDNVIREKDDTIDTPIEPPEMLNLSSVTAERFQSPDRRRSKSLTRKIIPRGTNETHKSHRSVGSIKLKGDDQVGLRSIFKGGAKIDGMIRGSVSKVTDLLWKRDSDVEGGSSTSSDSDSDEELKRGRVRISNPLSRSSSRRPRDDNRQKNYLDVMPPFKSASISNDKPVSEEVDALTATTAASRPSRSPRFDRLKPPRIDIRNASPTSSDLNDTKARVVRDSDVSDAESHGRNSLDLTKSRTASKDLSEIAPLLRPPIGSRTLSQSARHWSISNRAPSPYDISKLSRREVARLRALILCSGIKAMEISRRAQEPHPLFASDKDFRNGATPGLPWSDVSKIIGAKDDKLPRLAAPETQLYTATARVLGDSIERGLRAADTSTAKFVGETAPKLHRRVDALHDRVGGQLVEMTRRAADEADEVNRDLVDSQRLKVKRVVDTMDKMLRRRRRRFRWVRRAGWLAVEWVLVGFMWYVWFVVMIARVVLGVGKGVVGVVRWLLWL
ncbi:hypothetical protein GGS26DRAFT_130907 [Hypomontagnella submonticulosa]|nr:hypothetical protein GGS26DRAFT_130907 [Hypomontagnella submonticulosa]